MINHIDIDSQYLRARCVSCNGFSYDTIRQMTKHAVGYLKTHPESIAIASNQLSRLDECPAFFIYGGKSYLDPIFIPDITKGIYMTEEGCLSIPHKIYALPRYYEGALIYTSLLNFKRWGNSKRTTKRVHGFFAKVVQHECDHLVGRLISGG